MSARPRGRPFPKGCKPWNTGKTTTMEQRLLRRRIIDPVRGCWLWVGAINPFGYGAMTSKNGKVTGVHRVAYMEYIGDIPNGMQVDHLCFVRNCFNPAHLEVVTPRENSIRATSRLTQCSKGHRVCKTCARNSQLKIKEKNRGR